ncbi:PEP/pyruvate-binding domain-containing protein [Roseococcus pinisoli]|uniref:Pyruvate, phosphate dikinase n=1 Tax=Roseococcus pinisoli TaxID=2835040 RepID=A0ABS5QFA6_9PROT|nr:PEP/pyruvate-binding domain-containing protein [Roseococcus pinisoli]MBS7812371.1 hypothetical protein [Roseococcus pinisoli]
MKLSTTPQMQAFPIVKFGMAGCPGLNNEIDATAFLGGKGANLVRMTELNLPVPPGFTLPTPWCALYETAPDAVLDEAVELALVAYEELKSHFGYAPLVSVRSGAPVSMPGMMDTILNVGMTQDSLQEWTNRLGGRTALDSRRRLIQMLGHTAYGVPSEAFEKILQNAKDQAGVKEDKELDTNALVAVCAAYCQLFQAVTQKPFPETIEEQLRASIGAVFGSWRNERADVYRKMQGIPVEMGTAVTVQAMVFGNANDDSGSGVLFTRNPSNGEPGIFGEFLPNAQGEDVVAGVRTPMPFFVLREMWPEVGDQIVAVCTRLEAVYQDMMDVEFTVQDRALFMLQCRVGKRASLAKFRIAHDMHQEGLIDLNCLVSRFDGKDFIEVSRPCVDHSFKTEPTFVGLAGSPGVVTGVAVTDSKTAITRAKAGEGVLLVRHETDPDDIGAMDASVGILTKTGGSTSHAAVVARAMNKACVVGCEEIDVSLLEGKKITICGSTGRVWVDVDVPVLGGTLTPETVAVLEWAAHLKDEMIVISDLRDGVPNVAFILSSIDNWGDESWLDAQVAILSKSTVPPGSFFRLESPKSLMNTDDLLVARMGGENFLSSDTPWIPAQLKNLGLPIQASNGLVAMKLLEQGINSMASPSTLAGLMEGGVVAVSAELEAAFGSEEAKGRILRWCRSEFGTVVASNGHLLGVALLHKNHSRARAA